MIKKMENEINVQRTGPGNMHMLFNKKNIA